jgi:hypothetical protein
LENDSKVGIEVLESAYKGLYAPWKAVLFTENDALARELRVVETDAANLIGFCRGFMRDKTDPSFGRARGFVSNRVAFVRSFSQFRRDAEAYIGLRLAGEAVISDERRDALREQTRLLGRKYRLQRVCEGLGETAAYCGRLLETAQSAELRGFLEGQIEAAEKNLQERREAIARLDERYEARQKFLDELDAKPAAA